MYLEHFGLQRQPFKITPDTSMFYTGNKRGAALEALKYAIISGEGMIKVVGEVGSGKTMLCRMLEVEMADNIEVVYIANPSLSPDNILHVIAFELKLDITPESNKLEVMQALQNYLLEKHAHNNQVVVFVEEAQSMPVETLEEIRLLSNLETSNDKLLQMVLFGQPELDDKLRQPSIRQLKERITHNFYLDPFPTADVYSYLNFRMRAVGYRGPDLFTLKAANNIEKKSSGLTRRINILADKALLAAFSDGGHDIRTKHIKLAAQDSDFGQTVHWSGPSRFISAAGIILLSIWVGTLLPTAFHSVSFIQAITDNTATHQPVNNKPETIAATGSVSHPDIPSKEPDITGSLLEQRLEHTRRWLPSARDEYFTIQLTLLDKDIDNEVIHYLQQASQLLDGNRLYIYPATIRGRMQYSVLYSEYTERKQALDQLQLLPPWLKKNGAYLRTVKGIKADIRKTQSLISSSGGARL